MSTRCHLCGGKLSNIRTDGHTKWQHCYSCHFDFPIQIYWKRQPKYSHDKLIGFIRVCSNCGAEAPIIPEWNIYDLVDTCPNCGMKIEYKGE